MGKCERKNPTRATTAQSTLRIKPTEPMLSAILEQQRAFARCHHTLFSQRIGPIHSTLTTWWPFLAPRNYRQLFHRNSVHTSYAPLAARPTPLGRRTQPKFRRSSCNPICRTSSSFSPSLPLLSSPSSHWPRLLTFAEEEELLRSSTTSTRTSIRTNRTYTIAIPCAKARSQESASGAPTIASACTHSNPVVLPCITAPGNSSEPTLTPAASRLSLTRGRRDSLDGPSVF